MPSLNYSITLLSDAEPGSGLATTLVDQLVPRNANGSVVFTATHIKGLMRESLAGICENLNWPDQTITFIFGGHDSQIEQEGFGLAARFNITEATATDVWTQTVTRTSINSRGTAEAGSLRSVESIPKATTFNGSLVITSDVDSLEIDLVKLALLSVKQIGGNRNRGSGQCQVSIEQESRSAGELLRSVHSRVAELKIPDSSSNVHAITTSSNTNSDASSTILRLRFTAISPVCCPDSPARENVILGGFSIPASAVLGAVVSRIASHQPDVAKQVMEQNACRAWPLLPSGLANDPDAHTRIAYRVSLSHRVAKYSLSGAYSTTDFFDEALSTEPYDWRSVANGVPLKASDGVIITNTSDDRLLWKSSSMPRVATAHSVCNERERASEGGLFTYSSMAPMSYSGLITLPTNAAEILLASLASNPNIAFGKSKGTRGLGELQAIEQPEPAEWNTNTDCTVLVNQAPLLLEPKADDGTSAEQQCLSLFTEWANRNSLPAPTTCDWVNVGIRFGWNRHLRGRQSACRVITPGATIVFNGQIAPADLGNALLNDSISKGERVRGFGAISVHPGVANGMYQTPLEIPVTGEELTQTLSAALKTLLQMTRAVSHLPSVSQLSALQQKLEKMGSLGAIEYLKSQKQRPTGPWSAWEPSFRQILSLLENYDASVAAAALRWLTDFATSGRTLQSV